MDIILIAGLWLRESIWADVTAELERRGHHPVAVSLPGADDGSTSATLDDQVAAVVAAVDASDRPLVVGHSAACTLAWIAADQRVAAVSGLSLIGGFPNADGEAYADFFETTDGVMPFPGWEKFEGPDSADLDDAAKARLASGAVPVPEGVSKGVARLADEGRYAVPVQLVCPEFGPDEAKEWIAAGDLPELSRVEHLSYVDLDSGHWPMITRPAELAAVLDEATRSS
jgi:pimeloyl-ACP methyl ester carboxylesterase